MFLGPTSLHRQICVVPTGGVKSTKTVSSIYSMNNNTSDEDKHDTNYINNKYTNTYTRELHNLWART